MQLYGALTLLKTRYSISLANNYKTPNIKSFTALTITSQEVCWKPGVVLAGKSENFNPDFNLKVYHLSSIRSYEA